LLCLCVPAAGGWFGNEFGNGRACHLRGRGTKPGFRSASGRSRKYETGRGRPLDATLKLQAARYRFSPGLVPPRATLFQKGRGTKHSRRVTPRPVDCGTNRQRLGHRTCGRWPPGAVLNAADRRRQRRSARSAKLRRRPAHQADDDSHRGKVTRACPLSRPAADRWRQWSGSSSVS
jgi:hypothetical protein